MCYLRGKNSKYKGIVICSKTKFNTKQIDKAGIPHIIDILLEISKESSFFKLLYGSYYKGSYMLLYSYAKRKYIINSEAKKLLNLVKFIQIFNPELNTKEYEIFINNAFKCSRNSDTIDDTIRCQLPNNIYDNFSNFEKFVFFGNTEDIISNVSEQYPMIKYFRPEIISLASPHELNQIINDLIVYKTSIDSL